MNHIFHTLDGPDPGVDYMVKATLLEPGMTLMLRNEAAVVLLMNWGRIPDGY